MDRETALRELSKGNPDLQRRAARVLGRWGDDQVLAALIAALQSPHRGIREASADTLLEIGDARTVRLLLPLLRSGVPAVRNAARLVLQRLAKAAPELVVDLSRDPDVRMRIFAADIITESGDHDLAPPLLAMLDDEDENVRDAALVGLGRLGAPEAVGRLEEFASSGTAWSRFSAIDALGQIPSLEAVHALLRLLPRVSDELTEPVVQALGRQGATEAVGPLLETLRRAPYLAQAIIPALASLPAGDVAARMTPERRPELAEAVVSCLEANGLAPEATVGGLDLLGALGVRVRASVFVRLLASPSRKIQLAAVRVALKLRLVETLPLLRQLRSQGDPALMTDVQAALDVLGAPRKETL
jgi:HEAT repeat protein